MTEKRRVYIRRKDGSVDIRFVVSTLESGVWKFDPPIALFAGDVLQFEGRDSRPMLRSCHVHTVATPDLKRH